jgi:4-amino-4-deoxy-L-arabinose transferase-like glycosyltransferase
MAENSFDFHGAQPAGARRTWFRLFPALLLVLALVPRLVAIQRYITPDELIWVYRSIQFGEAALDGRWAGMVVAGHPGVTTTWLGLSGMALHMAFAPDLREAYNWLTMMASFTPDNVEAIKRLALLLDGGRVAIALVNSLGVVGVYLLARRLWGEATAVVAALFLALDPFLVGLSGLFHVDGLSATFVTLSSVIAGAPGGFEGGQG